MTRLALGGSTEYFNGIRYLDVIGFFGHSI